MTDPLFGSVSQLWPSIPPAAFGYTISSPMAFGQRPLSNVSPGISPAGTAPGTSLSALPTSGAIPMEPNIWGSGVMPVFGAPGVGAGLSAMVPGAVTGGVPSFSGAEIAIGVTAPALLTAVAMRRGQPLGPSNDSEIEDFIYDAFDLLPGTNDVEVRVEGGRATLTGSVAQKRLKRDVGEIAWAIPTLNDVQNNVTIATRRRSRAGREAETPAVTARKPA